ncbi:hypothetical protein [Anabaena sp. CCY 9402-a]|uniref:hypothetical protein n=1 Tax=Anabaena sp. CCY 9402-a TaxID=3103867 RepID=UPI0039C6F201
MLFNDGSVALVHEADYRFLYCFHNKKIMGGRGLYFLHIYRADRPDPYSRFSHSVELRPGIYVAHKMSDDNEFFVTLRVRTKKGSFDIESAGNGSRGLSQEYLTELAQSIDIH